MAAIFFAAITLGMIGSFHCIGMCGPLAFSLPLNNNSDFAKFTGTFLYNLGISKQMNIFASLITS